MKTDALTATFSALADSTRRAILEHLAEGEQTVTALAEPFVMGLSAISRHLKVLEEAGLIPRNRDAQWQPCRLDPTPLRDIAGWVEQFRQLWDDRLDAWLTTAQTTESESSAETPGDRVIAITRVINAPVALARLAAFVESK